MFNIEESKIDTDAAYEWMDIEDGFINYVEQFKSRNPHLSQKEAEKLDICAPYYYAQNAGKYKIQGVAQELSQRINLIGDVQTQSYKTKSDNNYDIRDNFIDDENVIQRKADIILSTRDDYFGIPPEEYFKDPRLIEKRRLMRGLLFKQRPIVKQKNDRQVSPEFSQKPRSQQKKLLIK